MAHDSAVGTAPPAAPGAPPPALDRGLPLGRVSVVASLPAAAAVAALGVRLIGLGQRSLWLDEASAVWLSRQPLAALPDADTFFPPLYPALLKGWTALGPWFGSDAGVRLPSALASAAGVGIAVWLVGRLRRPGAALVAALGVCSSVSVWYAQEARSVALTGTALLAAGAALAVSAVPTGPRRPVATVVLWASYVFAAVAALYLHYDAVPLLIALNAVFVASMLVGRRPRRWLPPWLLAQATVLLLYTPQLQHLSRALGSIKRHPYAAAYLPFVLGAAAGLLVLSLAWLRLGRGRRPPPGLLAAAAALGVLSLYAVDIVPAGATIKRHLAVVQPLVLAPAAVAIGTGLRPRWRWALVAAGLPTLVLVLFVHPKEPWREAAGLVQAHARSGDALVVYPSYVAIPFERYYAGTASQRLFLISRPAEIAAAARPENGAHRLWLIESHVGDMGMGSAAAQLASDWRAECETALYRITVRRFVFASRPSELATSPVPRCDAP